MNACYFLVFLSFICDYLLAYFPHLVYEKRYFFVLGRNHISKINMNYNISILCVTMPVSVNNTIGVGRF